MPALVATAVVLSGGGSRRFGSDKLAAPLGGRTVLDTLLASLPAPWPVVAVGRERPTCREVAWTLEEPPGGGPVAALAAGAALVGTELLVVVAGDMPFAGPWAVRLVEALTANPRLEAVAAADAAGRRNPLLAAYHRQALVLALPADAAGRPARLVLESVESGSLEVPEADLLDVDTPERLEIARRRVAP